MRPSSPRIRSLLTVLRLAVAAGTALCVSLQTNEVAATPNQHDLRERATLLVPDTADHQIPFVLEATPAGAGPLAQRVLELGGRITYEFHSLDALAVTIPRASLDELLADARVAASARQRFVRRAVIRVEWPEAATRRAPVRAESGGTFLPIDDELAAMRVCSVPLEEIMRGASQRGSGGESFFGYDVLTGAAASWKATGAGEGVLVAIVDTGIYPDHPMFVGNVIGGENLVPAEEEQAIDADDNGTADGFSFDWDAIENDGHGTFCAGLVAGHADLTMPASAALAQSVAMHSPESVEIDGTEATIRLRGTAPGASLYAVKVFPYDGGGAPDARIAEAIDRLVTMKSSGQLDVDVISMSLSGPVLFDGWNLLDRMVDIATLHGITCVSAASNDGPSLVTVGSPGSAKTSLTAGATMDPIHTRVAGEVAFGLPTGWGSLLYDTNDVRMIEFSSRGLTADGRVKPDLVATGFLVFSSGLRDVNQDGRNDVPSFGFSSGTSFSTPTIAGAAALVTAYGNRLGGLGVAPFVANVLKKAAVPIDEFASVSRREQGRGFVHVPGALDLMDQGAYFSSGPEDAVHPLAERLSLLSGAALGSTPELAPGTSYTALLDVPPRVSKLVFQFPNVTRSSTENPILGESMAAVVHTAKRGGNGDYVFKTNPFTGGLQPGTVFELFDPEPGTLRLTFSSPGFNYGPASASFAVRAVREVSVPSETFSGNLPNGTVATHEVEVPPGLAALGIKLSWLHDWRRFPTTDLDLAVETPDGELALATLDSPESAHLEHPAPGTWTFTVSDLGTALGEEPYSLDLVFVQPRFHREERESDETVGRIVAAGPNPAPRSAEVEFVVPKADRVRLRVFDVSGRLVRNLIDGPLDAGSHRARWDGLSEGGEKASAGVYFVRLDSPRGASVRKLTLID